MLNNTQIISDIEYVSETSHTWNTEWKVFSEVIDIMIAKFPNAKRTDFSLEFPNKVIKYMGLIIGKISINKTLVSFRFNEPKQNDFEDAVIVE